MIRRCIEPDAAARFQTSQELIAALDRLDNAGQLRPEPRRFGRRHLVAAVALVAALVGGTWWFASRLPPPEPAPVSVLIADFDNRANDPAFNGSLEQALTMALEEASFVNPYARETARNVAQLPAEGKLNENAARLVSVREGINVVLAGAVEPAGSGYSIAVRAVSPTNGEVRGTATASASSKEQVLQAVGSVASKIREILGDTADESVRLAASETVTAASLDAIRDYSQAQDLLYQSKDEEAIVYYRRAIGSDPNFGRAYSGWAISAQNLGRREEALQAWNKAVSLVDRMTDREKNRTLGNYYIAVSRNYQAAVESLKLVVDQVPLRPGRAGQYRHCLFLHAQFREGPRARPPIRGNCAQGCDQSRQSGAIRHVRRRFCDRGQRSARRAEPGCDRVSIVPAARRGGDRQRGFRRSTRRVRRHVEIGTAWLVTCHSGTCGSRALPGPVP